MAEVGILNRSTISCVENLPEFAAQLSQTLAASPHKSSLLQAEMVRTGAFHTHVDEILGRPIYTAPGKVGTFAFVDPCGVSGVRLKDLARLLKLDFGEVLLLFNSDGVNRLLGGFDRGTHDNRILVELFGTEERLDVVHRRIRLKPSERELIILEEFTTTLKAESGAGFFLRFRFKAKDSDRSSHYLIHVSNHPIAFKIMKSVMWVAGNSDQDPYGRLEFLRDHERGTGLDLFRIDLEGPKTEILTRLRQGQCRVSEITDSWVSRPTDNFSDKVYRQLLIDLESAGKLLVYDKQNQTPKPASERKPRLGKPTLADDYWLRSP
jgi:three-Cys-motif partner protein